MPMQPWFVPFAAAVVALVAGAALAQHAALGQSADSDKGSPYQEALSMSCEPPDIECTMHFTPVPAGRRRVVESVSCFHVLTAGSMFFVELGSQTQRLARAHVPISPSPGSPRVFVANLATQLFYDAGEVPRLDASAVGGRIQNAFCTLSGRQTTAS